MLNLFTAHRETLNTMYVTTRDMPQDEFSDGIRLTLGIYLQILSDAVSVLDAIIAYLPRHV
jgi:hypothetical protein